MSKEKHWDRPAIELPPGWHKLIGELAREGPQDLKMKYVYTLAVFRLLTTEDIGSIVEEAWEIERECREHLDAVAQRPVKSFQQAMQRYRDKKRKEAEAAPSASSAPPPEAPDSVGAPDTPDTKQKPPKKK